MGGAHGLGVSRESRQEPPQRRHAQVQAGVVGPDGDAVSVKAIS